MTEGVFIQNTAARRKVNGVDSDKNRIKIKIKII